MGSIGVRLSISCTDNLLVRRGLLSQSRSGKRKITEGTVAVPNSGRASVAAGLPSQQRAFSCPTCGPISTNRSLHIDNHHVPWWVSPDRICLHCRLECNTVLRLLRRHGHRDCSTAYYAGYKFWAEWMDTALREVAGHFSLTSLTDLFTLMRQQQWYPVKEVDTPTPAEDLHMRAWATYTGRELPERYHLSPPNDVACLVSRPIVRQWVMQVPRVLQEKLKDVSSHTAGCCSVRQDRLASPRLTRAHEASLHWRMRHDVSVVHVARTSKIHVFHRRLLCSFADRISDGGRYLETFLQSCQGVCTSWQLPHGMLLWKTQLHLHSFLDPSENTRLGSVWPQILN